MRDSTYGFEAIAQRYQALGGDPVEIPFSHLFNLADALHDIYGLGYIAHRRMYNSRQQNDISGKSMLTGEEEARAFENGDYVSLHTSTQRKAQIIQSIAQLEQDPKLETDLNWWQANATSLEGLLDALFESLFVKIVGLVGVIWVLVEIGMLLWGQFL